MLKKLFKNKYIIAFLIVAAVTIIMEIFAFNISSWKSKGTDTVLLAKDVTTDGTLEYVTEAFTVNGPVVNVNADIWVENHDIAYVSVILTDEGDKYEYATPEYEVCNNVAESGFSNIYPFDDVHTISVRVRVLDGCIAHIHSIEINAHKPVMLLS